MNEITITPPLAFYQNATPYLTDLFSSEDFMRIKQQAILNKQVVTFRVQGEVLGVGMDMTFRIDGTIAPELFNGRLITNFDA